MRAALAGAFGALAISGIAAISPQSGLMNSYLEGPDDLRLWALVGLSTHFLLYLLTGMVWVGLYNKESVPTKAFQLGIAAPTAVATLLNISTTPPTFSEFDAKIPSEKQEICQFSPYNAFIYGVYAFAIPKGVNDCRTIVEVAAKTAGTTELASKAPDTKSSFSLPEEFPATLFNVPPLPDVSQGEPPTKNYALDQEAATASVAMFSKLSQPAALAVSDALAEKLKSAPEEKHELVDALVSSIKPASESDATAANTNVVRTLALGGSGWAQNAAQTNLVDRLKTTPAYESDSNYRYWVDQALDAAQNLPADRNRILNGNMPAIK